MSALGSREGGAEPAGEPPVALGAALEVADVQAVRTTTRDTKNRLARTFEFLLHSSDTRSGPLSNQSDTKESLRATPGPFALVKYR
jgi:hypothetical protein